MCLGGFILPFAKAVGRDLPAFDFSLPGVTSMSVDTHKYGYAAKGAYVPLFAGVFSCRVLLPHCWYAGGCGPEARGRNHPLSGDTAESDTTHTFFAGTSVVLYRHRRLRRHQFFCFPNWTGGLYVTPTIAGSRPGALSAACWAAMVAIGRKGYEQRSAAILETTRLIAEGVKTIPGLKLQGQVRRAIWSRERWKDDANQTISSFPSFQHTPQAEAMIVCVGGADGVNIHEVGDRISKKGWNLNSLQSPPGIHLCVTLRHVGKHEAFLTDLREVRFCFCRSCVEGTCAHSLVCAEAVVKNDQQDRDTRM